MNTQHTSAQGARAGMGFNKLLQEVRHRQGGWGHSLDHPPYLDKSQNSDFLRKSFFLMGGPKKLYLALETPVLGGSYF